MHTLRVLSLVPVLAGCTGEVVDWTLPAPDPFAELERLQREGPPRYASRVHSCPKTRYRTLGNLLASRGVDLAATASSAPASCTARARSRSAAQLRGAGAREHRSRPATRRTG
jgi:hypothetical protein